MWSECNNVHSRATSGNINHISTQQKNNQMGPDEALLRRATKLAQIHFRKEADLSLRPL